MSSSGKPAGGPRRPGILILFAALVGATTLAYVMMPRKPVEKPAEPVAEAPLPPLRQSLFAAPPVARQVPVDHVRHGETWTDPYDWLRDKDYPKVDDADVLDYLKAENAYTDQVMGGEEDGLRAALFAELKARVKEDDTGVPYPRGAYVYQSRFSAGQDHPVFVRWPKDGASNGEQVVLDVNTLAEGKDFYDVEALEPSPDGRYLAYSFDDNGSENFTIVVKDMQSGELVGEPIPGTSGSVVWAADNRTLFYVLKDESQRPKQVMRNSLGAAPAAATLVYEEADPSWWVGIGESQSGRFVEIGSGTLIANETRLIPTDDPTAAARVVIPRQDDRLYSVADQGENLWILINDKHLNFRLVQAPLADWSEGNWTEVMAGSDRQYLTGLLALKDWLVVFGRQDGTQQVWVRGTDGQSHTIAFPDAAFAVSPLNNEEYETGTLRVRYHSLVTPPTVFDYDLAGRTLTARKVQEIPSGYDPSLYTSERLMAPARDGTPIPVSIVYRKDFKKDGKAPLHLYGYGSYSIAMEPGFSTARIGLLDRGFAYAIAHIRGGEEMGRPWHDAGRLTNKPNTFNDFLDVAQFLVNQGYTSPGQISIEGGSAGGTLMGAVLNMGPDGMFAGAVAHVPFVDVLNTLFDETLPLTTGDYPEWGNPNIPEIYQVMKTYSPYDNVARRPYPPILITAGLNDYRVTYWEPAKWAAKLRTHKTDDNVLLLKTEMSAGHGGSTGRFDKLKEVALSQAFILRAHGLSK
ncbi:S9 family peptidase [Niveispirillum fermenti]|uniref:S9 family peptidase n=1 Tax=Niveispirillum fermenti TaxID=1233113 RepID=UPI003A8AD361